MCFDGVDALERVALNDYDVLVLDRDIPGVHGDDVCAAVARDHPDVRVLKRLHDRRRLGKQISVLCDVMSPQC